MQSILVDSLVINTAQAASADVALAKGVITFDAMGTTIPLRKVLKDNAYRKTVYAAGTAQTSTFTIGNVPDSSTNYTLSIQKFPAVANGIQNANPLYSTTETYTVITDATATAIELVAALEAAIAVRVAAGTSAFLAPVAAGTNVLTLIGATSNFSFLISMSPNVNTAGLTLGVQATSAALIKTSGTYTQVVAINDDAVVGNTYTTISYRWYEDLGDDVLKQGQNQEQCFEVLVFINVLGAPANSTTLIATLDGQAAGTATAATYLGF